MFYICIIYVLYIYYIQYLLIQTNIYVFYMLNESWAVCGRGATEEEERVRRRPGRRQTSDVAQAETLAFHFFF